MKRFPNIAACAACLALLGSCSGEGDGRVRNAVLITLDTTRRDALSCYGAPAGVTPHLDALAAEGLIYDDARTVVPITLPAHVSMLTGLYPPRHTVRDNGLTPVPPGATTIAERASEAGCQTAAFVAAIVLDRAYGVDQGFDVYDQPAREPAAAGAHFGERTGDEVAAKAAAWLRERDTEEPFFLWAHFFDPHAPYEPPQRFLEQAGGNAYLGDVAWMDAAVGELLDALRDDAQWDETLVVVVSDHGEGLGEHGEPTHSNFVYETTLAVPLIVRDPSGHRAGERSDEVVSVVDVYPTVLEALGLGGVGDVDGRSLFRRAVAPGRGVYFESYHGLLYFGWSGITGWADRDGKYVHSSSPELYDVRTDPKENANLIGTGDASRYTAALERLAGRPSLALASEQVDGAMVADLQALGYLGSAAATELPDLLDPGDAPSPHASAEELGRILLARQHGNAGRYDEAIPIMEQILAANPSNHEVLSRLGTYQMKSGRRADAIATFERFAREGPVWPNVYFNLATCYLAEGREAEALEWFRRTVDDGPPNRAALDRVIALLEKDGRYEEALPYHKLRIEMGSR